MLNTVLILLRDSGIQLFEERIKDINYNSKLFSGLLTAVQGFCSEINIGECNVFSSDEYKIVTISTNFLVVALIIEKSDPHIESFWKNLGVEIGKNFENTYDLTRFRGKVDGFKAFNNRLRDILNKKGIV